MEHDHMIEALAPNGTDHPLHIGSLPRGSWRGQHFLDTHVSHLSSKLIAENRIGVAEQVARELVEGKCLPQLLPRPLCGRVGGHIEVKNTATVMGQYQKYVEDLEADSGHSEEIDGDQLRGVILQECAPSLRRRLATVHHVFAYAGFSDIDTEFEQLAVNAGCTPTRILAAHSADELSDFTGNRRPSRLAPPDFPGPEETKALAMPRNDRVGLDNSQNRTPVAPDAGQQDPQKTVPWGQLGTFSRGALKYDDLVAQSQVLQLKSSARTEDRGQSNEECREGNDH